MIDQLDGFKGMASEPQFWDKEKLESANNEFQQEWDFATPEWTAYMKEQIKNNLYWIQTEASEAQENPDEIPLDQTDKVCNNVDFPIIHRLYTSSLIKQDTYNAIVKQIFNTWKLNMEKLTIWDSKQLIQGYIDQRENQEANEVNLRKDYPDFIDWKDNTWIQNEAYSLIAKNYIKIEAGENDRNTNKKENFSTALELATNHILETAKSIPRDTQTFTNALRDIHSNNTKNQLNWFESLYLLTYSYEWISAKAMDQWKSAIKQSANKRIEALREQYVQAMEKISIAQNKSWEISEINKQEDLIALIKVEANEIFLWDIFQTWELDYMSDSISELKEATV